MDSGRKEGWGRSQNCHLFWYFLLNSGSNEVVTDGEGKTGCCRLGWYGSPCESLVWKLSSVMTGTMYVRFTPCVQ